MAPVPVSEGLVYRKGNLTKRAFTPRPAKDTVDTPGKKPGLSTWYPYELEAKEKVQVIDLGLLRAPLGAFEDDPDLDGGEELHVSIVPVTTEGEVDQQLLEEWAASRESEDTHELTQMVLDAVVHSNVRRN